MRYIGVIGAFGFNDLKGTTGGQPVKTRTLYYSLREKYGKDKVLYVETYRWKLNPVRMILQLLSVIRKCDTIILLPAQNGVKIFLNILLKTKRKGTKLFYDVIGGWIAEKAQEDVALLNQLTLLNGIWVETSSMADDLLKLGVRNVEVIPNFKDIELLKAEEIKRSHAKPFRFCTFSRVMREKGIPEAITSIIEVNSVYDQPIVLLDIYGPIDETYKHDFEETIRLSTSCIRYRGVADPMNSVEIVKQYDALLFPTLFYTEGIPGTIIDSYSAGVPIMTSLWVNSGDVFWEGETGWGYPFGEKGGLKNLIVRFLNNPDAFFAMQDMCIDKAKLFSKENAMKRIISAIENG